MRLSLCQRGEIKLSRDAPRSSAITRASLSDQGSRSLQISPLRPQGRICVKCIAFGEPTQGHLGGNTQIPEKAARDVRLFLCQRGETKLSRDAPRDSAITRARGEGGYSNAPSRCSGASWRLFFGDSMQRTAKRHRFFYAGPRPRETRGGVWGAIVMLCLRAELPVGSFLGTQCSAPMSGTVSFMRDCARARRGAVPHKRNTPAHRGGALHWQEL